MPVYPVTDSAKFISGTFIRPYIVKNSGDETVYLGQDSSLTVATRAFSLPVGSTLNWSGDTELYAVTDAGVTSEIELLFTGENSFTPGPSTVQNRSITDVTTLATGSRAIAGTPGGQLTFTPSGLYDVSDYSSVLLDVYYDTLGLSADAVNNFFSAVLEFYRDVDDIVNGIPPVWVANPQWLAADATATLTGRARGSVQAPVLARYLNIRVFCNIGTFFAVGTAHSTLYGSSEVINKVRYSNSSNDAGYGLQQWGYQIKRNTVISDNTEFIASTNDPLYAQIYRNLTAAAVTYVLYTAINGVLTDLWNLTLNAGAGAANYHEKYSPIYIPMTPLALRLRIQTANSDAYIDVSQDR